MPPNYLQKNKAIMAEFEELVKAITPNQLFTIDIRDHKGELVESFKDIHGAVIGYLTPERIAFPLRVGLSSKGNMFTAGMVIASLFRGRDTISKAHPEFEMAEELTAALLDAHGGNTVAVTNEIA